MKKLILIVFLLCFTTLLYAEDRVKVQVEFRKAWWTCPKDGTEWFTDLNVGTPSTYTSNCPIDGTWVNSFKEYDGVLSYPKDVYETIKKEDIDKEKQDKVDTWIYEVKNPPLYVKPSLEELLQMKVDKQREIDEIQAQIDEKDITPDNP